MKLVVASNNPGKLREFGELLAPLGWEAVPQNQFGVAECDEPHATFVENALEKARHAARCTGLPALADDSGLCVHALGGAPGVYSARYAQASPDEEKSDARNNLKLVAELAERAEGDGLAGKSDRRAHYVCVLAFVRHAGDPQPIIAEGEWYGEILDAER
ncbi:MAG: non-canonical purine NTP pyrophosphatase, partial [Propionivibrio sp.]